MKKYLKEISKHMKTLAEYQANYNGYWQGNQNIQRENLTINKELLTHSRISNRLQLNRFELEYMPLSKILEELLKLIAVERITDEEKQKIVDDAKRIITLLKVR